MSLKYFILLLLITTIDIEGKGQSKETNDTKLLIADSLFRIAKYKRAANIYKHFYNSDNQSLDTNRLYRTAYCLADLKKDNNALFFIEQLAQHKYKGYERIVNEQVFNRLHKRTALWESLLELIKKNNLKIIPAIDAEFCQILTKYKSDYKKYNYLKENSRMNSPALTKLKTELKEIDSLNFMKILSIVNTYGWKGAAYFGKCGAEALIVTLLHADIRHQKKWFSLIRQAALEGALPAQGFAIIADNIALTEHNTQIYGTHLKIVNGQCCPFEIYDEAQLEDRRKLIGLPSTTEYLKNCGEDQQAKYYLIE